MSRATRRRSQYGFRQFPAPPLVRQLGSEKPEWAADPEGLAHIGPADAFYNAAGVRYAAETWG